MTTKQAEWKEYTGSDEQIAELINAKYGYVIRYSNSTELIYKWFNDEYIEDCTHYWIIPGDPLREIKVRWAMTGQPVWIKRPWVFGTISNGIETYCTTTPDWNIPNAEYSFTPFKD